MLLDAPTFELRLTPESAIGTLQKGVAKKGWKKFEVQQIRLVYVPFYVFFFDVTPTGGNPISAKTAINAYSGELNDFIPALLDQPLKKTKQTAEKYSPEVESTSISSAEIKDTAQAKVAAQVGVPRDQVAISAVSKYYFPFFRVWANVSDDQFKFDVDGCMGAAMGLDNVPGKEKGWNEVTSDTIDKMKTPSGLLDLFGQTISALFSMVQGKKGPPIPKQGIWLVAGIIIIALVMLSLGGSAKGNFECKLDSQFLQQKTDLFFFKKTVVVPLVDKTAGTKQVSGACNYYNTGKVRSNFCGRVWINADGRPHLANESMCVGPIPPSDLPTPKKFVIIWDEPRTESHDYKFEYKLESVTAMG